MSLAIAELWAASFAMLIAALALSRVAIFVLGRTGRVAMARKFADLFDRYTLFLRP
jgi:hypothetical protein